MKSNIRVLLLTLLVSVFASQSLTAQGMPVYDNTNFISFAKSLIESAKQTSQLLKTVQFLKTQKENIEKVNNAITQLKAVKELTQNNKRLFDLVQDDLREILNSPYIKAEEVNRISDSFNAIIENSMDSLEYIDKILSSGTLKMTDAERAEVLKEKERESKDMVAEIEAKTRRYREIIAFREMQDIINNRQTNY
ncbi:conjugal transfer protein [Pseudotamlana carrageenivorans]|uniref:Conjugal transfer protein n=1 Tax=Pseudotamlana carrageenivorans TaxID=2069432 RepID=A0A2I7SK71_9FLAO|nr:conjugal transfer protein [Tamlana carrageenivorans]AUS06264.1 conjugal transfer protein [Tamlana carrageenivorans]